MISIEAFSNDYFKSCSSHLSFENQFIQTLRRRDEITMKRIQLELWNKG